MAIGGFVNQIKAKLTNPTELASSERVKLKDMNWTLMDTNGKTQNLQDFKGKVLFINNWATWCPPCIGEMPEIQKLYDIFKNEEAINFLMVSNEKLPKITAFMDKKGYTFPVYASKSNGPDAFISTSIPTTFIVSKNGEIVVRETGAANWAGAKMQKLIKELIAQ